MRLNRKTQYYLFAVGISTAVGITMAGLFWSGFFVSLQALFTDKLFTERTPSPEIVIVAIDNESIKAIGRWPWDRSVHADFFQKLAAYHPRVVVVDIAFLEPTKDDALMAESLRTLGNTILALEADIRQDQNGALIAEKIRLPVDALSEAGVGFANTPVDGDGILRRVPLEIRSPDRAYLAFFAETLKHYSEDGNTLTDIPLDENRSLMINFAGGPGTF